MMKILRIFSLTSVVVYTVLLMFSCGRVSENGSGGRDNLKKGIKANRYYVDKKKHPESPIQLFKQIGAHSSGRVIKMMLMKDNDKVKFVGIMKKV